MPSHNAVGAESRYTVAGLDKSEIDEQWISVYLVSLYAAGLDIFTIICLDFDAKRALFDGKHDHWPRHRTAAIHPVANDKGAFNAAAYCLKVSLV